MIGLADRNTNEFGQETEPDDYHCQDPAPATEGEQADDADDRGCREYDVDAPGQDRGLTRTGNPSTGRPLRRGRWPPSRRHR